MPVGCPEEKLSDAEFAAIKAGMGKRGQRKRKRAAEVDEGQGEGEGQAGDVDSQNKTATRAQKHAKIREYGKVWKEEWGRDTLTDWMYHQISDDLWWIEGLDCSYHQVRYILRER